MRRSNIYSKWMQMASNHDEWAYIIVGACILWVLLGIGIHFYRAATSRSTNFIYTMVFISWPSLVIFFVGGRLLQPKKDFSKPPSFTSSKPSPVSSDDRNIQKQLPQLRSETRR